MAVLLLENGSRTLLEDGSTLLLEEGATVTPGPALVAPLTATAQRGTTAEVTV